MGRVKVGGKEVEKKNVKEGDIGYEVRKRKGRKKKRETKENGEEENGIKIFRMTYFLLNLQYLFYFL